MAVVEHVAHDLVTGRDQAERARRRNAEVGHRLAAEKLADGRAKHGPPVGRAGVGRRAGAFQLQLPALAGGVHDLAQADGPPVAELAGPAAELMPAVASGVRLHAREEGVAREHLQERVGRARRLRQIERAGNLRRRGHELRRADGNRPRSARSRRRVRRARPSASRARRAARARSCCRSGAREMLRRVPAGWGPAGQSQVRAGSPASSTACSESSRSSAASASMSARSARHARRAERRAVHRGHHEAELALLAAVEAILHHRRVLALPQLGQQRGQRRTQPLDRLPAQLDLHDGRYLTSVPGCPS